MTEKLWTDVERKAMDEFKKEIKNNAKPDKQFDTVEMGLKWMKTLRN